MAVSAGTSSLYYLGLILALLVTWIVVSIPLYFAGKLISGKRTTFGRAMVAAIVAPVVTFISFIVVDLLLILFLGPLAVVIAFIIAILVLSYVYASMFRTGMLGGFGIAVLATVITYIIAFAVMALLATYLGFSSLTLPQGNNPFMPKIP